MRRSLLATVVVGLTVTLVVSGSAIAVADPTGPPGAGGACAPEPIGIEWRGLPVPPGPLSYRSEISPLPVTSDYIPVNDTQVAGSGENFPAVYLLGATYTPVPKSEPTPYSDNSGADLAQRLAQWRFKVRMPCYPDDFNPDLPAAAQPAGPDGMHGDLQPDARRPAADLGDRLRTDTGPDGTTRLVAVDQHRWIFGV